MLYVHLTYVRASGGLMPRYPMRSSVEKELRSSLNTGFEAREGRRPIVDWDESQLALGGTGQGQAQAQGQGVGVRGSVGAGAMRAAMAAARERLDLLLRLGPAESLVESEDVLMELARRRIADKLYVPVCGTDFISHVPVWCV